MKQKQIKTKIKNNKISEKIQTRIEKEENTTEKESEINIETKIKEEDHEDTDREDSLNKRSISLSRSKENNLNNNFESLTEPNESKDKLKDFYWRHYPIKENTVIQYISGNLFLKFSKFLIFNLNKILKIEFNVLF